MPTTPNTQHTLATYTKEVVRPAKEKAEKATAALKDAIQSLILALPVMDHRKAVSEVIASLLRTFRYLDESPLGYRILLGADTLECDRVTALAQFIAPFLGDDFLCTLLNLDSDARYACEKYATVLSIQKTIWAKPSEEQPVEHCEVISSPDSPLRVVRTDQPGPGGAYHRYEISGYDIGTNDSRALRDTDVTSILFQNGPIGANGVNGITQEALLEIVADRLRCFQAGKFANLYNARALEHVEAALQELHARTAERKVRGVEGTHKI